MGPLMSSNPTNGILSKHYSPLNKYTDMRK